MKPTKSKAQKGKTASEQQEKPKRGKSVPAEPVVYEGDDFRVDVRLTKIGKALAVVVRVFDADNRPVRQVAVRALNFKVADKTPLTVTSKAPVTIEEARKFDRNAKAAGGSGGIIMIDF